MTEELDILPDGTGRKDKKQVFFAVSYVGEPVLDQSGYSGADRSYGGGRVVSYSCFRRFNVEQLPELSDDP